MVMLIALQQKLPLLVDVWLILLAETAQFSSINQLINVIVDMFCNACCGGRLTLNLTGGNCTPRP